MLTELLRHGSRQKETILTPFESMLYNALRTCFLCGLPLHLIGTMVWSVRLTYDIIKLSTFKSSVRTLSLMRTALNPKY